MKSQIIEIGGAKFRIDTYAWEDGIDSKFFSSLDTPADQYQELTLGGWMEGDHFNIFEGITFRGAAFEPAIREGKLKVGETYDWVLNQIQQTFMERVDGYVATEPKEITHPIIPAGTPPPMPIHDSISDEDGEFIGRASDLLDFICGNHRIENFETEDTVYTEKERMKLVFHYLELDYDGWMAEKDALMRWIQEDARKKAQQ